MRTAPGPADLPGASLALAGLLLALALPRAAARPIACDAPSEIASRDGWTVGVACVAGEGRLRQPLRGPARLLFGGALDANRADVRALEVLPGIGPARAQAIVRERERRPFTSLGDLERVHGVGPRTVERLAGQLEVGPRGEATPAAGRSGGSL